jgi:hypothetical protein
MDDNPDAIIDVDTINNDLKSRRSLFIEARQKGTLTSMTPFQRAAICTRYYQAKFVGASPYTCSPLCTFTDPFIAECNVDAIKYSNSPNVK